MNTTQRNTASQPAWWVTFEPGIGDIDPRLLAEDLDQPRRHIREADLEDLEVSIKEHGVRDHLVVTPRHLAPWVRVAPEDAHLPFVIASGHRRRLISIKLGLSTVPILVRHYATESAYREDASILNAGRQELTPIEQGWEATRQRRLGAPVGRIIASLGLKNPGMYYERLNLTRLAPDLQLRLAPELPPKRRLPLGIGAALGGIKDPTAEQLAEKIEELGAFVSADTGLPQGDLSVLTGTERRFALQRFLLDVVIHKNMHALVAIDFIKLQRIDVDSTKGGGARSGGAGAHIRRHEPNRRRDMLDTFIESILRSGVAEWPSAEWGRIFSNTPKEEVTPVLARLKSAGKRLQDMIAILERIHNSKRPTSPEVARLLRRQA